MSVHPLVLVNGEIRLSPCFTNPRTTGADMTMLLDVADDRQFLDAAGRCDEPTRRLH